MANSEQVDRQLAAAALEKQAQGVTPSRNELRALERQQKVAREKVVADYIAAVPKGDWRKWSGRQHKILDEQAERYGLPIGGATIDLPAAVKAFHDLLAANKHRLAASDDDDAAASLDPDIKAARLAFIREGTRQRKIDADRKEGMVIPRDQVHATYGIIASAIRAAGDSLQRAGELTGEEAYEILQAALTTAEDQINSLFNDRTANNE